MTAAVSASSAIVPAAAAAGSSAAPVVARWTGVAFGDLLATGTRLVLEDDPTRQLDAIVGVDVDDPDPELIALRQNVADVRDALQREF
jgi:hypothetical protein